MPHRRVLVNNAGVGYLAAIEEGADEDIRWQFETKFFGAAALIRAILPGMRSWQRGAIVNISSVADFVGYAGMGYYAASKFALESWTESLWHEVEQFSINVLLVEPGGFRTGIVSRNRLSGQLEVYAGTSGRISQFRRERGARCLPRRPEARGLAQSSMRSFTRRAGTGWS